MANGKPQRIRDPLHNLIEFNGEQLETVIWNLIKTRPFQRLRRIKQLGFSEYVFPGATHTRFAHSIGVFHTARKLLKIIGGESEQPHQARVALVAALVHDVGHGMFSHSFEAVGKELDLPLARHEKVSELLIRDSEISMVLSNEMSRGFCDDVANMINLKSPKTLYDSVVSSQFDADRLDYMQRDRLMTGVQSSGIDETWLLSNIQTATIDSSIDEEKSGSIETFVLGPKAYHAAENYILSLFQLYPNVYMHKTTRGAERIFQSLIVRIVGLARNSNIKKTGLPFDHPILRFAKDPERLENALALDDTVFWGSLPHLLESKDWQVQNFAAVFYDRKLPKCIDIQKIVEGHFFAQRNANAIERSAFVAKVKLACNEIARRIRECALSRSHSEFPILVDQSRRPPYKKFEESNTQLNQILIRQVDDRCVDMADLSPVVANAETFEICRAYHFKDDSEAKSVTEEQIKNILRDGSYGKL